MRTAATAPERVIGDLAPVRHLLAEIGEWEAEDKARRPEGDPVVHVLTEVRRKLEEALDKGADLSAGLTVDEFAALEGVGREAIYMRMRRGRLGARVIRHAGRLMILPDVAA